MRARDGEHDRQRHHLGWKAYVDDSLSKDMWPRTSLADVIDSTLHGLQYYPGIAPVVRDRDKRKVSVHVVTTGGHALMAPEVCRDEPVPCSLPKLAGRVELSEPLEIHKIANELTDQLLGHVHASKADDWVLEAAHTEFALGENPDFLGGCEVNRWSHPWRATVLHHLAPLESEHEDAEFMRSLAHEWMRQMVVKDMYDFRVAVETASWAREEGVSYNLFVLPPSQRLNSKSKRERDRDFHDVLHESESLKLDELWLDMKEKGNDACIVALASAGSGHKVVLTDDIDEVIGISLAHAAAIDAGSNQFSDAEAPCQLLFVCNRKHAFRHRGKLEDFIQSHRSASIIGRRETTAGNDKKWLAAAGLDFPDEPARFGAFHPVGKRPVLKLQTHGGNYVDVSFIGLVDAEQ